MAPPSKRRKGTIARDSDDEDAESRPPANLLTNYLFSSPDRRPQTATSVPQTGSPSLEAKKATQSSVTSSQAPAKPLQLRSNGSSRTGFKIASTSPEKAKGRHGARGKLEEKGKSADLKMLFSKQAERLPNASPTKLDDIISDPISDDDNVGEHRASMASRVGSNARKRLRDSSQSGTAVSLSASQKFLRPPRPTQDSSIDDEQRPWCERFAPVNLDELAVHKKKIADVRGWLEDVMAGRIRHRILILKGAAGTGKTTTIRLLARELRYELLEWRNPVGSLGATQGFQSASAQFEEFMGKGGRFGQLDMDLDVPSAPRSSHDTGNGHPKRMILIEEFPNTFTRSSSALQSFRSTVMHYLASNTPSLTAFGQSHSKGPIIPIVMVISETLLTTTSSSADSFTAHRLLGPDITRHPGTCVIEFNAVAPTLLASALGLIVQKEARKSGRRRTPGPQVLQRLGEIGDIRSAISSLEFLCLKGDTLADWGSKVAFTKSKRASKDSVAMTKGEADSLELISQREASLGIFHAVGKVVYNKREDVPLSNQTGEGSAEELPTFIAHCSRSQRSLVRVDDLIDETGTDTHTFISALHENYVLSCEPKGPLDQSSSIDYINNCLDYLSDSDVLSSSSDIFFGGRGFAGSFVGRDSASHALRQDEITFQVATRGLLFSLPHPVKRKGATTGRGGPDAFKMFYPASLKLWREKEELEGIVDHWSTRLLKGEESSQNLTDGASLFRRTKAPASPGDWIGKQSSSQKPNPSRQVAGPHQSATPAPPLLSLGNGARRELLLERLPYMAHVSRRRKATPGTVRLKDIEKVVSFSGLGVNSVADDETLEAEEGFGASDEAWATDKPSEESSPRKKGLKIKHRVDHGVASALPVQKLVLSDDDIEDD